MRGGAREASSRDRFLKTGFRRRGTSEQGPCLWRMKSKRLVALDAAVENDCMEACQRAHGEGEV